MPELKLEENGAVAQLGARLNGIQEVRGSIPLSSTENKGVMALAVTPFSIKLPISYQVARVGTNTQSGNFHN